MKCEILNLPEAIFEDNTFPNQTNNRVQCFNTNKVTSNREMSNMPTKDETFKILMIKVLFHHLLTELDLHTGLSVLTTVRKSEMDKHNGFCFLIVHVKAIKTLTKSFSCCYCIIHGKSVKLLLLCYANLHHSHNE